MADRGYTAAQPAGRSTIGVGIEALPAGVAAPLSPSPGELRQESATTSSAVERRAFEYVGTGECATAKLDLFDQWSGPHVPFSNCEAMCAGLATCLGFEYL